MQHEIQRYWEDLAAVMLEMPSSLIAHATEHLLECHRRAATIFVIGNGGSAATASHFACDLAKNTRCEGAPAFRVVPLTDNMPIMTAWANDTCYDRVFAEQVLALVRPGDVVVVITASGNSPNVLAAAEAAREKQATVVALTGRSGGRVRRDAYLTIPVPSDSIERVEDVHLAITHCMCVALREGLQREAATQSGTGGDEGLLVENRRSPALLPAASPL